MPPLDDREGTFVKSTPLKRSYASHGRQRRDIRKVHPPQAVLCLLWTTDKEHSYNPPPSSALMPPMDDREGTFVKSTPLKRSYASHGRQRRNISKIHPLNRSYASHGRQRRNISKIRPPQAVLCLPWIYHCMYTTYVCVCVCMCACMYVCAYIRPHVRVYTSMYV